MVAAAELYTQLRRQLPSGLRVVPDVDLDVQLAPSDQPGTARRPDLVVVTSAEFDRVGREGGLAGDFGYQDGGAVTGTFSTSEPAALQVDLDALG